MIHLLARVALLMALGFALSSPVWPHSETALSKMVPPHGGLLAAAGPYHLELVLKPDRVQVFVTDHLDRPISIQGVTAGSAILRIKGKSVRVPLQVAGDRLEGPAAIPPNVSITAAVTLTIGGTEQMAPYVWPAGGPKQKTEAR
jgi:hypothetical protein